MRKVFWGVTKLDLGLGLELKNEQGKTSLIIRPHYFMQGSYELNPTNAKNQIIAKIEKRFWRPYLWSAGLMLSALTFLLHSFIGADSAMDSTGYLIGAILFGLVSVGFVANYGKSMHRLELALDLLLIDKALMSEMKNYDSEIHVPLWTDDKNTILQHGFIQDVKPDVGD